MEQPFRLPLCYRLREPVKASGSTPLLVVLHGYAQNPGEMQPLLQGVFPDFRIFFLQAPYHLGNGRFLWFSVQNNGKEYLDAFEENLPQKAAMYAPELALSRKRFHGFVQRAVQKYRPPKTALLGFSQGASLVYSLLAAHPQAADYAITAGGYLSPVFLDEVAPPCAEIRLQMLLLHGRQDRVVPPENIQEVRAFFRQRRARVDSRFFQAGHSLTYEMVQAAEKWLKAVCADGQELF